MISISAYAAALHGPLGRPVIVHRCLHLQSLIPACAAGIFRRALWYLWCLAPLLLQMPGLDAAQCIGWLSCPQRTHCRQDMMACQAAFHQPAVIKKN